MNNLCNCPNCQTDNCPSADEYRRLLDQNTELNRMIAGYQQEIDGYMQYKLKQANEIIALKQRITELKNAVDEASSGLSDIIKLTEAAKKLIHDGSPKPT